MLLKIAAGTVVSYFISLVLSYFGYLLYVRLIPDCGFGCGFGMAIAGFFYIPIIAAVLCIPVYMGLRRWLNLR